MVNAPVGNEVRSNKLHSFVYDYAFLSTMVSRHSTPHLVNICCFFQPPEANPSILEGIAKGFGKVPLAQGTFLAPCPVPQGAPTNSHPDLQETPPVKDKDTTNTYFEKIIYVKKPLIFRKGIPTPTKIPLHSRILT